MRITIVSAHEGATTWVNLFRFIDETTIYQVCSFNQYDDNRYRSARSAWERFALRIETFVIFPLRFIIHSTRISKESDFLLVVSSPFFMPVLASMMSGGKKIKIISLMNDIYPEALVSRGIVKRNGIVERFMKKIFMNAFSSNESVVFITDHHKALVTNNASIAHKSRVIHVSAHSVPFQNTPPRSMKEPVQITYCGTLGLMHDTSTFLEWIDSVNDRDDIRFVFHTSGAAKHKFEMEVRRRAENRKFCAKIFLGNPLKEAEWIELMKTTQVGLVFQDKDSDDVIFPSKVASILASGQAVLAVADKNSELARIIIDNDCGWVVQPHDVVCFSDCISELLNPALLLHKRKNAFTIGHKLFGRDAVAELWVNLFDRIRINVA